MQIKRYKIDIPEEQDGVQITCRAEETGEVVLIHLDMRSPRPRKFPGITCRVTVPACGVHYLWTPKIHLIKALNSDWFSNLNKANGFTGAPVQCLIGQDNRNRAALAVSDTLNTLECSVIPVEETGEYTFEITMFGDDESLRKDYEADIRLDLRTEYYYEVLKGVSKWWEQEEMNRPAAVPELAKWPMYSTWYSYHQMVEEEELIRQCRTAEAYGCRCLLLDDGWQTEDGSRGYAYCGDWQSAPSKLPDMKRFVKRVHELGMKVIPWYTVPFIGEKSENFERFKDMLIDPDSDREWHVLDPRYPQVREFIISTYECALVNWDLDGFKLDFVDEFVVTPFSGKAEDERRDFTSFTEAADHLMKSCISRLKAVKPDILLEFRQTYNGPLMRSYGNIFRAVDCPFDDLENHVRVTDIRLLAGESAVHSDMLMWHPEDSAESAALQLIQVMFSVPQISMRLEELKESHRKMLSFYLGLWEKFRDALVNGAFEPLNPACRYNVVKGYTEDMFVCTCHSREVITTDRLFEDMLFMNGSEADELYMDNRAGEKVFQVKIYNCTGHTVSEEKMTLTEGLHVFRVPASGAAVFRACKN